MTNAVTVLAVDDQPIFLRALAELVAATPGFDQVGEAASGPEALELVAALDPDLVLLDARMPGMDGIETARRLAESGARSVVVLISIDELPDIPDRRGRPVAQERPVDPCAPPHLGHPRTRRSRSIESTEAIRAHGRGPSCPPLAPR